MIAHRRSLILGFETRKCEGNISKPLDGVNEFSSGLWNDIETCLARTRSNVDSSGTKRVAVFDADGTLWDADAGETFFQWQLDNCDFKNLPSDPWAHYRNWKKRDPHGAYAWLAQISRGQSLSTVREWADICFREHEPWPYFRSIKELFKKLSTNGFEIYIVTASVKWAVEPAALHILGVPHDHVLGIETETENKTISGRQELIITDVVKTPVTYRQGKAEALLKATGGRRPILAAGNTLGDIALLDAATDFKLMIQSESPLISKKPELVAEEKKLRDHGRPLGWRLHAFRS